MAEINHERNDAEPSLVTGARAGTASNAYQWLSIIGFIAGLAIAAGVFFWLGKSVLNSWDQVEVQLLQLSPELLMTAAALIACFFLCFGLSYHQSLLMAGANIRAGVSVCIYLASLLGKYVPGRVLLVAGQVALTQRHHVSIERSLVGFTVHHLVQVSVGILMASPLLISALTPGLSIGAMGVCLISFALLASGLWTKPLNLLQRRRNRPEFNRVAPRATARAALWVLGGWMSYSGSAVVLTMALRPELDSSALWHVGTAAIAAWLIGFLSLITPSGLGIREGSFVLLATEVIPEPTGIVIALMLRFLWTCLEGLAGTTALVSSLRSKASPAGGRA
ncbi:MAG TPA: lysylphosphatidylglycerol synthase domain-containing protein [Alphaproteobacteria bacterium]|nr:lysylphosphatidylglycerol synthase domain-containing protein [Alphaproteobacteria bacterium]